MLSVFRVEVDSEVKGSWIEAPRPRVFPDLLYYTEASSTITLSLGFDTYTTGLVLVAFVSDKKKHTATYNAAVTIMTMPATDHGEGVYSKKTFSRIVAKTIWV